MRFSWHRYASKLKNTFVRDKEIRESGAFVVPTILVNEKAIRFAEKDGGPFAEWAKAHFLPFIELKENIRRIHQAGIPILAGTDNGNFDLNWGDDLINELMIYSQCGLDNVEVLQTATGNPAHAWGIPVGNLHVGSKANLLLLNGNPIENLEVLRDVHTVWKNGIGNN